MYTVTKQIFFCYGHRLMHYQGKCRHLHGHDVKAEIELQTAELDHRGMVMDFADLKTGLKIWIDQHLDHKMLLHKDDPIGPLLQAEGEPIYFMDSNPTAENIAKLLYDKSKSLDYPVLQVRLWESPSSCASYSEI